MALSPLEMAPLRPARLLAPANLLLIGLLVVHSLDHTFRQDAPVPTEAATAGLLGLIAAVAAFVLSLAGSRLAPVATGLVGIGTAAGFVAVHVLPEWSVFSQPYSDIDVDAISWAGMVIPAVAAAVVGVLGFRAVGGEHRSLAR